MSLLLRLFTILALLFCFTTAQSQPWQPLDASLGYRCSKVFVDTATNNLYAAGYFTSASGITANRIAMWDGTSWSTLGAGFNGTTFDITVYNGELYVVGAFTTPVSFLAKWDGTSWVSVGGGIDYIAVELAVINNELHVGGSFTHAGGVTANRIAKWDGTSWSTYGIGLPTTVQEILEYNGEVITTGSFYGSGTNMAQGIARWNGTEWVNLGGSTNGNVYATHVDTATNELYIGGNFGMAGSTLALAIAKWDGTNWSAIVDIPGGQVNDITQYGGDLIVGGEFTIANGGAGDYLLRWDGSSFSQMGTDLNSLVVDLEIYNDQLTVAGAFRWNGPDLVNYLMTFIDTIPTAGFTYDLDTICLGESVAFTDTSSGTIISYDWVISGGSPATSSAQNPSSTFTTPGTYDVQLIVANSGGPDTLLIPNAITVLGNLTNYSLTNDTALCDGACLTLQASGATNYTWSSATMNDTAAASMQICPNIDTDYFIRITTSAACAFDTVSVLVNTLPVVTIAGLDTICEGEPLSLTAFGASTYLWNGGSNSNPLVASPSSNTTYQVVGTDSNGCLDSASFSVAVTALPIVSITGDTEICEGDTATLIGSSGNSYSWSTGQSSQQIEVTPTASQNYSLIITEPSGCSDSASVQVIVYALPATPIISQNAGDLTSSTALVYQWYDGSGVIVGATSQNYTPLANGQYWVEVTDVNGCSSLSDPFDFQWIGVEEIKMKNLIQVYPNPADELIYVHFSNTIHQIEVVDIMGHVVISKTLERNIRETTIDLASLASGCYTLMFLDCCDSELVRIVVR
jgi:PKD repeat protein